MTQRTKLVDEIYRLKNELNILNGEPEKSIEEFKDSKFYSRCIYAAKNYELKSLITSLKCEVARTEYKQRIDAFYATEEGAALKAQLERELEESLQRLTDILSTAKAEVEAGLQNLLGSHWIVEKIGSSSMEIGIRNEDETDKYRNCIFGQTASIYYDICGWRDEDKERFEINIGSCGGCRVDGGMNYGERSRYYIGLGQLFAATEFVAWFKARMFEMHRAYNAERLLCSKLEDRLNNPIED